MSVSRLHLEELRVTRMPGFPPSRGFRLEGLSPGINVIHGPNESGKTTVAQAVCMAVHGVPDPEGLAILEAKVGGEAGEFTVKMEAGHRTWLRDGDIAQNAPPPPGDAANRYKLWLHELLRVEDPNRDFARQILEESAAGYRLRDARDALGFRPSASSSNITERRDIREANRNLGQVTQDAVDPRAARAELQSLREQKEEAEAKRQRAHALECAREFRGHATDLEAAEGRLQELPSALEKITGDEPERLADLRKKLALAEDKESAAEASIRKAEQLRSKADLPKDDPPDGLVSELRARVQKLGGCEGKIEGLETDLAEARARAKEARDVLGSVTDLAALAAADSGILQRAERLCERAEALREKRAVLEAVEAWLGDKGPDADRDLVHDGLRALERWLREAHDAEPPAGTGDPTGLVASLVVVLVGLAALLLGLAGPAGVFTAALGLVVLVAGGLLFWLFLKGRRQEAPTTARPAYRRDFERTSLEPPAAWEDASVEARVEELRRMLAEIDLAREREEQRARLAPDRKALDEETARHEREAEALTNELGVDLRAGNASFLWFVKNLAAWQGARLEVAGTTAALEKAREQRATLSGEIASRIEPYGYPVPADADEALVSVEALDQRFTKHRTAERDAETALQNLEDARDAIEGHRNDIDALWAKVGLDTADAAALQRLCGRLEEHQEAKAAVSKARVLRNQALGRLRDEPGHEPSLEEMGATEIEAELEALGDWSARLEALGEEIPRLEERIQAAKKEHQVEAALEDRERALARLRDRMESEVRQAVGWAVAEAIHEETRHDDRPEVFKRAGRILTTITRGRYELRFRDVEPPEFRAADTLDGETKSLDQLSSGTRVQLLLAVRLAFLEHQEQGARWPLLLDETLATSDDIRARAIVDAVVEIAREGRQVFYLTAQADEVAKWRGVLKPDDPSVPPYRFIDLATVRSLTEPVDAPGFEPGIAARWSVPHPEGLDHAAYGRALEVRPFDLAQPVERLHLWYLIDDPELLHALLEAGCEAWGQLRALRTSTRNLHTVLPDAPWNRLQSLVQVAAACHAACGVGRGTKVDRAVLAESPGITENKIDEVVELAARLDGDGAKLLAALARGEVPRFWDSQREKLEEFLLGEGYVDNRPRLSREDVERRTLAGVAADLQGGVLDRSDVLSLLDRLLTSPST